MATSDIYSTARWRYVRLQALDRARHRCAVGVLLGPQFGTCNGVLSVHHVTPLDEGGEPYDLANLTVLCAGHHHRLHGIRRYLLERDGAELPRCGHYHPTAAARELCERRMIRRRAFA